MYMYSGLSDGLRCACCALCLFIVGGPIFIIAGIVLLVIANPREGKAFEYNTAAAAYKPVSWPSPGTINNQPVVEASAAVVPSGSKDGINIVTSQYVHVTVAARPVTVEYRVGAFDFDVAPTYSSQRTGSVTCDARRGRSCSQSETTSDCRKKYGAGASSTSSCYSSCTCIYPAYLRTFCAVAVAGSTGFTQSCFYPFGMSDQGTATVSSASVDFELRARDDPFIAMQRITEGSMDFGLTSAMQRTIAFVCLGIGICIIICDVIVGVILYKAVSAAWRRRSQGQPSGAHNGRAQPAPYALYTPPHNGCVTQVGYGAPVGYAQPNGSQWHGTPVAQQVYAGSPQMGYCASDPQWGAPHQQTGGYVGPTAACQPPACAEAPLTYGVPS